VAGDGELQIWHTHPPSKKPVRRSAPADDRPAPPIVVAASWMRRADGSRKPGMITTSADRGSRPRQADRVMPAASAGDRLYARDASLGGEDEDLHLKVAQQIVGAHEGVDPAADGLFHGGDHRLAHRVLQP
jgi:hypothetical protein